MKCEFYIQNSDPHILGTTSLKFELSRSNNPNINPNFTPNLNPKRVAINSLEYTYLHSLNIAFYWHKFSSCSSWVRVFLYTSSYDTRGIIGFGYAMNNERLYAVMQAFNSRLNMVCYVVNSLLSVGMNINRNDALLLSSNKQQFEI